MSKKEDAEGGILKGILSFILDRLMKDLGNKIRSYILDATKSLIKKTVIAIIGAELIIIGFLFICISLVKYVSIHIPIWEAWFLVGFAVLVVGCLISVVTLRR